jgi:hypothetical protein
VVRAREGHVAAQELDHLVEERCPLLLGEVLVGVHWLGLFDLHPRRGDQLRAGQVQEVV